MIGRSSLAPQAAVLTTAAVLLALVPPASGALLLVPLGPAAAMRMLPLAIGEGARMVGRGPLPDSMVVVGERATLWPAMLRAGVIVTAAPAAGCARAWRNDGQR